MSRVLVTGGAGFIGSHLVRRLSELGDEVFVLDSLEEQVHHGAVPNLPGALMVGDVGDRDVVDSVLRRGFDRVVHLAAVVGVGQSMYEAERYVRRNTLATATFIEALVASKTRPRLVVASSMSIYGEGSYACPDHGYLVLAPGPRPVGQLARGEWEPRCPRCGGELLPRSTPETKPLVPTSVYATTKRDQEELCLMLGRSYGVPTTALRFFNVYGPGQSLSNPYTGVAAIFASRLLKGREPVVFEDGLQTRDLVHVSDVVDAIVIALETDAAAGRALNVGTGSPTSVLDVAEYISFHLTGRTQATVEGSYRAGDVRHCYADVTEARRILGFQARVAVTDGLHELVDWLRDQVSDDQSDRAMRELAVRGLV